MRVSRDFIKALHVTQAGRGKSRIYRAALDFFTLQLRNAATEIGNGGTFDPRAWDAHLVAAMRPPIGHVTYQGAAAEMKLAAKVKATKTTAREAVEQYDLDGIEDLVLEFPAALIDRIEATLANSFARPYWAGVNDTTRDRIAAILRAGTIEGLSIREIAKQIRAQAPGIARSR
jgi:hypothetical protein